MCEIIANQAGKVGIKVDLVSQEYAVSRRKDGVNRGNCRFTTPVAAAAMPIAISKRIFAPVCRRKSNYSNPEFDKLIDEEQKSAIKKGAWPSYSGSGVS